MKDSYRRLPVFMITSGGLGNQLFALALAHEYSKKNRHVVLLSSPWNPRGHDSASLSEYCSHNIRYWNRSIKSKSNKYPLLNKITRYTCGILIQILNHFAIDVTSSFVMKGTYDFGFLIKGCLQRSDIVSRNPEFTLEVINRIISEDLGQNSKSKVICHLRRGDYALTDFYGLLSVNYYMNALKVIGNSSRTVISDDELIGNDFAKKLSAEFLDTSLASPFKLLALMNSHEVVISANSSLSWWGGYLRNYTGGRHLIPTPWLKNTFDDGRWLHYEGCEDVVSIFENS